jgi:dipeptidyl aminopeptidase/acylaminoacyl peptidase
MWAAICAGLVFLPTAAAQPELRNVRQWDDTNSSCAAISPDGGIVACEDDDLIRLRDVASGKEQAILKAGYSVYSLAFSPDGKKLAGAMAYNNVKLWDVATRQGTTFLNHPKPGPKVQSVLSFARPLVAFSPDGKALASGGKCIHEIRLWDVATAKQTGTHECDDVLGVRALTFTPDGRSLASLDRAGTFKVWDLATGKETATWQAGDHALYAVFSPDGKTLAAVREDETNKDGEVVKQYTVKLWAVATRKEKAALRVERGAAMTFSPDGKTFALGGEKGTIKLWDVPLGKELVTVNAHTGAVLSLAFSGNGTVLVSCSEDKAIKVWDIAKAR